MRKSEPIAGFRCVFHSDMSEDGECGLYLAEYNGELFVHLDKEDDDDESGRLAGTTRLFVLNADAAERDDVDLCELLDRRSETAAFIPLIGEKPGNFSVDVCRLLNEEVIFCRNLLLLDRLEILPEFRGQELGLKFMKAAITRFGMGCRLAALKPFPLQFESAQLSRNDQAVRGRTSEKVASAELRSATAKLKTYYARAGFIPLSRSELMILDLENHR